MIGLCCVSGASKSGIIQKLWISLTQSARTEDAILPRGQFLESREEVRSLRLESKLKLKERHGGILPPESTWGPVSPGARPTLQ